MKFIPLFVLLLSLFFISENVSAQNETTETKIEQRAYTAQKIKSNLSIDGDIREDPWNQANWASSFSQKGVEVNSTFDTKFKILFDQKYLYIALQCMDGSPDSIPMYPSPRDNNSNDWLEVDLDTNNDKETAYAFVVSPYGVRTDMSITGDDDNFDESFHPKWEVKTGRTKNAWTAEMKIPFDQMLIPKMEEQSWGLQITRHISRKDDYSNWQPMDNKQGGWVSQFGALHGLHGIQGKEEVIKAAYDVQKVYAPSELKIDFQVLTTVLKEIHPAHYLFSSKEKTASLYDSIEKELNEPMTEFEFYKKMTPIFNALGDGHTWIRPSRNYVNNLYAKTKLFPVGVKIVKNKIFITKEFSGAKGIKKGMEILSINDRPSKEIILELCEFVSADGQNRTWKIDQVSNNFDYYLSLILGSQDEFKVLTRESEGTTATLEIAGLLEDDWQKNSLPPNQNNFRKNNWNYEVIDDTTAYLSINTFARGSRFRKYMDKTFEAIKKDGIKHLIIDVRDNGGGNDSNGMNLYSYLSLEPFKYFKRYETKTPTSTNFLNSFDCCISAEEIDFIAAVSTIDSTGTQCLTNYDKSGFFDPSKSIQVQPNAYAGDLYVLANGGSFSVASDFCSVVQDNRRGVLIGEETGGGYMGNTSGIDKMLILPNTNLRTRINFIRFVSDRKIKPRISGRGVLPNLEIKPKQSDIAAGIDTEYEFALKVIPLMEQ